MKGGVLSIWFAFVLLSPLSVFAKAVTSPCPDKCDCYATNSGLYLYANCSSRWADIDPERLYEQLDELLVANVNSSLRGLIVASSPLMRVPPSLCQLTTLTYLDLRDNQITRLPDCLGKLAALTVLSARSNNITELQDGVFHGLRALTYLDFSYNQMRNIGIDVFSLSANQTSLQSVALNKNNLTSLEPWPYIIGQNGDVTTRVIISLRQNFISEFTNRMNVSLGCKMPKAYVDIYLQQNKIGHIQDIMTGWGVTTFLDAICVLDHYEIKHGEHAGNIHRLLINDNFFICDCVDYVYFAAVRLMPRSHILSSIYCRPTPEIPVEMEIVRVPLDQLVCQVTERCPASCHCVYQPANAAMHINCSNANLTSLPLELPHLPKSYTKYDLHFSDNCLLRSLQPRDYFAHTSILDVSNCNVDSMDFETWKSLATVKQSVLLNGNRLQTLPQSVTSINWSADRLSLYNNPWKCSCDSRWMAYWLNSTKSSLINTPNILCSTPSRLRGRSVVDISNENVCAAVEQYNNRAVIIGLSAVVGLCVVTLLIAVVISYRRRIRPYCALRRTDQDNPQPEETEHLLGY